MSESVKNGVVKYYDVKATKNGKFMHTLNIGGDRFSSFADDQKARANPGDEVEFQYEQNGKYYNIKGAIKVLKRGQGHQKAGGGNFPSGQDDARQESICRQSSMNYAAQVVAASIQAGQMQGVNTDEAAAEVIRLADQYFFPFAMKGEKNNGVRDPVSDYAQQDTDDFDDDLPF